MSSILPKSAMAPTGDTPLTADEAVAEVQWIGREARALSAERVDEDSQRWQDYLNRKRALMEYIEATL
jgi:hypothetical protein